MQRVLICNILLAAALSSTLCGLEKPDETILYEEVLLKPPLITIGQKRVYVHDIALKNTEITVTPRTFFCLAQLAMVSKAKKTQYPIISHDYHVNGSNSGLEILSYATILDDSTQRYWQYYIFQVITAKKGKLTIELTPMEQHLAKKSIIVNVT